MSVGTADAGARAEALREVMATFPSGATIVTTADDTGRWWGFTATAFCPVSLDPPLVLVCLARSAQCHAAFQRAERWAVHIVGRAHAKLAMRFAQRGADKFTGAGFVTGSGGVPVLPTTTAVLECSREAQHAGGDHSILLGRVENVRSGSGRPIAYVQRAFHDLHDASWEVDG